MQLSLSAGGTPDQAKAALAQQAKTQLGDDPSPAKTAAAATVLDYVADEIAERGAKANDSVSVSVSLGVTVSHWPAPESSSALFTPHPPGTQSSSMCGASAKVVSGMTCIPHSVRTGSRVAATSETFAPGIRENTSYGPVKSSCVTPSKRTMPMERVMGVSGRG